MGEGVNDRRLSAYHIKRACDESLQRLQTDHIDLYQMHHIDRETPWEEVWQAMEQLVREGKILYAGSSNFAGWHITKANEIAKNRNFMGLVSDQSLYNLRARTIEMEVLPVCEDYGLGVIPWSPLDGGLLGGVLSTTDGVRRATENLQKRIEKLRPQIERYEAFCKDIGENPADIALAWLLANPVVTAPIIGPRTMAQLEGNLNALTVTLTDDQLQTLDDIWPGPGGPSPEAYAW